MNYKQKLFSTKGLDKDESIPSPITLNTAEITDNMTSDNNEKYPWLKT